MPFGFDDLLLYSLAGNIINSVIKPIGGWLDSRVNDNHKRTEAISAKNYQHELDLKMLARTRELDHDSKIRLQQESFKQRLAEAEFQYEQYKNKSFDQRVWPLKSPFEHFSLQRLSILGIDHTTIVPCRVFITKANRNTDYARYLEETVNVRLSMFLEKGYGPAGTHPVISHIGDWRNDDLQDDVFIKSLWDGLHGQPVIVLNPQIIDNGNTLNLRISFWGLGTYGSQPYPVTNTLLSIDIANIRGKLLREASSRLRQLDLSNISNELKYNFDLLQGEAQVPDDIREIVIQANIQRYRLAAEIVDDVNKEMSKSIAATFSCFAGLYADVYHLVEYGTAPIMPVRMVQEAFDFPLAVDLAAFCRGILARLAESGYHADNMKFIYLNTALSLLSASGNETIAELLAKESFCLWLSEKDAKYLPPQVDVTWDLYIKNACAPALKVNSQDGLFVQQVIEFLLKIGSIETARKLRQIEIMPNAKSGSEQRQLIPCPVTTKTCRPIHQESPWDLK